MDHESPPLPPVRGTIIRLDDADTGFSPENPKEQRRYLVIDVWNDRIRIVPLCTHGHGVFMPEGTLKDDSVSGYFIRWSTNISVEGVNPSASDEYVSPSLFFVGNQHIHPRAFLVLGVFWPPMPDAEG